jgi:hypothetical protein
VFVVGEKWLDYLLCRGKMTWHGQPQTWMFDRVVNFIVDNVDDPNAANELRLVSEANPKVRGAGSHQSTTRCAQ